MAAADYYLCDNCGNKTFYDADLNYSDDGKLEGVGDMAVICDDCAKEFAVVIFAKSDLTAFR